MMNLWIKKNDIGKWEVLTEEPSNCDLKLTLEQGPDLASEQQLAVSTESDSENSEALIEAQCAAIRRERQRRLSECDSISPLRWDAMTASQKESWRVYRQGLLDITKAEGFPWGGDVNKAPWPALPSE